MKLVVDSHGYGLFYTTRKSTHEAQFIRRLCIVHALQGQRTRSQAASIKPERYDLAGCVHF